MMESFSAPSKTSLPSDTKMSGETTSPVDMAVSAAASMAVSTAVSMPMPTTVSAIEKPLETVRADILFKNELYYLP